MRSPPMLNQLVPWSLRGLNPFLNSYGDAWLFRAVRRTPPVVTNTVADTGIHTIVPHRHVNAYLLAVKSLLRYYPDCAVYVHEDGTVNAADRALIEEHIVGVRIIDRKAATERFADEVRDPFLARVRSSYTSYLK